MVWSYAFGVGAILIFWWVSFNTTGKWAPFALAHNEAKEAKGLSASKFQALIWTAAALFAYASVFGARLLEVGLRQTLATLPMIPLNLLLLMGFSATTAVGSKGVTVTYKTRGVIPDTGGSLTLNPEGQPDMVKAQMVVWSLIGAMIYLASVVNFVGAKGYLTSQLALPDVDGTLLVLMGVSQGSYLGNKLVTLGAKK
jgi:hypothetical protein